LQCDPNRQRLLRPHTLQIRDKRARETARHVEEINQDIPGEGLPERGAGTEQVGQDVGGVDAEAVGGEVVDEPDGADDGEAEVVVFYYEEPGRGGPGEGFALEGFGFLELDAEVEEREGWEDPEAETDAPGGAEVVFACDYDLRGLC
jgi:hypothetical protein